MSTPFIVQEVPIQDKNLIEASAGTGKTYSIAILVLRAILEGKKDVNAEKQYYDIDDILVVTFTNLAVAELRVRIRGFIKLSLNYANGIDIDDPLIKQIIDHQKIIESTSAIIERLNKAINNFDEATIVTIHGFSQLILKRYAIETKLSFQQELIENTDGIIQQHIHQFYRKYLYNLDPIILQSINIDNWNPLLIKLIKSGLSGDQFRVDCAITDDWKSIQTQYVETFRNAEDHYKAIKETNISELEAIKTAFGKKFTKIRKHKTATSILELFKKIEEVVNNNVEALELLAEAEHPIFEHIVSYIEVDTVKKNLFRQIETFLFHKAFDECIDNIKRYILDNHIMTFDSMISQLHQLIVIENNTHLKNIINQQYPIVFIDEFQDTDIFQFETFEKLFIQDSPAITFLIGDPKQSIYAFRNADVESYLNAKSKVNRVYSMSTNHRSSEDMVEAVNELYEEIGLAEAFGYNPLLEKSSIMYERVKAKNTDLHFYKEGNRITDTVTIQNNANKEDALEQLTILISDLLDSKNQYQLVDKKTKTLRNIIPSDIGILVSSNSEGSTIKSSLQKLNIPTIQIGDEKLLLSEECHEIIIILKTMLQPTLKQIHELLITTFLDRYIDKSTFKYQINENELLAIFKKYQILVQNNQLYEALTAFLKDFNAYSDLINSSIGLRKLTNFEQIIGLINEQQHIKGWNVEDILLWLYNAYNNNVKDNHTVMELESDEDAVKILTLHKSKGLEYNIVVIYNIGYAPSNKANQIINYKLQNNTQKYVSISHLADDTAMSQLKSQNAKEKARVFYVGITRSIYACFIINGKVTPSTSPVINILLHQYQSPKINKSLTTNPEPVIYNNSNQYKIIPIKLPITTLQQSKNNWWKMSYSSLAIHHPNTISDNIIAAKDSYDHFIFELLPRGPQAGTILHELFETIPFDSNTETPIYQWDWEYRKLLESFDIRKKNQDPIDYSDDMKQLLHHTFNAVIPLEDGFKIKDILREKSIFELEFQFNVNIQIANEELKQLLSLWDAYIYDFEQVLEGLMVGFIDLFFEHEGKYYLLDWKSNHLGNTIDNYNPNKLYDAMTNNNYHLQYLIYTVAICKYLRSKIPNFDYDKDFGGVIYVFLRGVREQTSNGIFTHKPEKEIIEGLDRILYSK